MPRMRKSFPEFWVVAFWYTCWKYPSTSPSAPRVTRGMWKYSAKKSLPSSWTVTVKRMEMNSNSSPRA